MTFDFKRYTSNNPLLREEEDITSADLAADAVEEEVTVSSSGVEMQEGEVDVWNSLSDKFDELRYEMSSIYAAASDTNNKDWMNVLNVAVNHLNKLEGVLATASAKLGVMPTR